MQSIKDKYDKESLLKAITVRQKGEKIKTNKPKDGVEAYVWRMARFHSGADRCIPVMADIDLSIEVEKQTGTKLDYNCPERKDLVDHFEAIAKDLVDALGLGPMRLTLDNDFVKVTGNTNSMNGIAVESMAAKVNSVSDKDTLMAVYVCASKFSYVYGESKEKLFNEVKEKIADGSLVNDSYRDFTIGKIRLALVQKNGGSINGTVDHWLDLVK